jgi:hypothetical protein
LAGRGRKREAREWDERYGKLTDLPAFQPEILPLVQGVPLRRLQRATGLSLRYVSLIRRGEKTPHPRHWGALAETADCGWRSDAGSGICTLAQPRATKSLLTLLDSAPC